MPVMIALFRGVNVGGAGTLPMKELVEILEGLGCRDVETYIRSGNVVFHSIDKDLRRLAGRITAAVEERAGFAPLVLVLEPGDLEAAIKANPFPEAEAVPASLHLGFLDEAPSHPDLAALEALKAPSERFALIGRVFYLHAPEGVGRSKLAAKAERLIGVAMTDRNWRTVAKLAELAKASKA